MAENETIRPVGMKQTVKPLAGLSRRTEIGDRMDLRGKGTQPGSGMTRRGANTSRKENTMMTGEYTIVDLNEYHMPDVLRICRQELGTDYHSEADFRKCLGSTREHF